MEIVEQCGGVYPGESEMWYPFTTALKKVYDTGKPDQRTIRMAIKALVDSGKLRQVKFSFKDRKGSMVIKTLITFPNVPPDSALVKEVQKGIINADPNLYIPPEAEVDPELRKTYEKALSRLNPVKNLAIDTESKVELQYVPSYIRRAEMNKAAALERRRREEALSAKCNGSSQRDNSSTTGILESDELLPRRRARTIDPAKAGRTGPVKRLARLKQPSWIRPTAPPSPPPAFAVTPPVGEHGPIWGLELPAEEATFTIPQASRDEPRSLSWRYIFPLSNPQTASAKAPETKAPETEALKNREDSQIEAQGRAKQDVLFRAYLPSFVDPTLSITDKESRELQFYHLVTAPQDPSHEYSRVVTVMDPKTLFHSATGTFSTEYATVKSARERLWIQPDSHAFWEPTLPSRLEDITMHGDQSNVVNHADSLDPAKALFDWNVEVVEQWEQDNIYTLYPRPTQLCLINHTLTRKHETVREDAWKVIFERPITSAEYPGKGRHVRQRKLMNESRVPHSIIRDTNVGSPRNAAKRRSFLPSLKTRRLTSLLERTNSGSGMIEDIDSAAQTSGMRGLAQPRRQREPQLSRNLVTATTYKIMTAVVVVRTITGGLQRNIDWVLLDEMFKDEFKPNFIHSRWSHILQKNRLHVEKLQTDFQEIFIEGYKNGEVPPIDYDNLHAYDWAWLVDWAQQKLEVPDARALPSLPGSRDSFDHMYDLRPDRERDTAGLYEFNSLATVAKRMNMAAAASFTVPLRPRDQKPQDAQSEKLSVAKSWVRANIITPEEVYKPDEARRKLLTAGEDAIESALKELISDRILQQENKGRPVPGRNYDISISFLNSFKKSLETIHFHQAVRYKVLLDDSFARTGAAQYSYHASDGETLALINLVARKRVTLTPRNPPMNKFGLTEDYKTRQMDKSRLNFAIDIRPTDTYIHGNPLLPLPPPPQRHLQHPECTVEGRVPVWFDIHGNFVPVMWDLALTAVLALMVLRPGIGVTGVEKLVKPSLERWEVEWLMEWLIDAKAAKRVGGEGYVVDEWWWACLGAG